MIYVHRYSTRDYYIGLCYLNNNIYFDLIRNRTERLSGTHSYTSSAYEELI